MGNGISSKGCSQNKDAAENGTIIEVRSTACCGFFAPARPGVTCPNDMGNGKASIISSIAGEATAPSTAFSKPCVFAWANRAKSTGTCGWLTAPTSALPASPPEHVKKEFGQ